MVIPLSLFSHQDLISLECAFVAFDIIMSHCDITHPSAKYHGLHHLYNNCNYGSLYLSDYLYGTLKK